jgi:ACT domain-containing protein
LFAYAAKYWDKLKACRKTSVKDVEKGDDGITSRKSVETDSNQKPSESDLSKVAFVDDKYIENFETLENRAKSLELRLEDRSRELADLILNINKNKLPEVRINSFGPGVEDRSKKLEDKLDLVLSNNKQTENRTKKLENKLEDRTKMLEEKLDLVLNNNKQVENQMNLVLKLKDRTKKLENKLEERTKTLENKLEERTKTLENKLEDRTKTLEDKLNTILEHLKSNK